MDLPPAHAANVQELCRSTHTSVEGLLGEALTGPPRSWSPKTLTLYSFAAVALFGMGMSAAFLAPGNAGTEGSRAVPPEGQHFSNRVAETPSPDVFRAAAPAPGTGSSVLTGSVVAGSSGAVVAETGAVVDVPEAVTPVPDAGLGVVVSSGTTLPAEETSSGSTVEPRADTGATVLSGSGSSEASLSSRRRRVPVQEPPAPVLSSSSSSTSITLLPHQIGVYFTEGSVRRRDFLVSTLDRLSTVTGAALIFNVKGSAVFFDSPAPLAQEFGLVTKDYDLPEVLRLAKERGIYTIGRFIAVKDYPLAQRVPEAQIRHPKTGRSVGGVWVDAAHPTVLTYNQQVLETLVTSGIDEVNLDYIRYPTEYAQSGIGLSGAEKADHLEQFIRMARETIDRAGSKTKLGISTYAILGWDFPTNLEPTGQDIVRFAPYVDVISPMAYPATFAEGAYYNPAKHPRSRMYYLVYRTLTGYRDLLGADAWKLRPWIQGYGITAKNIRDEIDAVFDAGACGFTVWNASNEYGLVYAALPTVQRPAHCGL